MMVDNWKTKEFEEVALIANGQVSPLSKPYIDYYHLGPDNVDSDTGRIENIQVVRDLGLTSGKYLFDENSIVYSKIRPNLNKVCTPDFVGICSADMYPLWPKEGITKGYLYQFMRSSLFLKQAIAVSMRTGLPKINRDDLNQIEVLIPPPDEQHKIAEILSTWDRAIDLTAQLIAAKQQYKRGLMQQLLTGKRRFRAFQKKEWASTSFGQIFYTKSAKNIGSHIKTPITVGKYAIRPQNEHFNRIVASDNLENYNIIEQGDFVYDPMSAYYGAFGRYELEEPGIVSPVYRVLHINPNYDSDFIKHFIKSHYIAYQLSANSSQGNREGKRRTIQTEAFDSISFKIPDIDEQRAIAEVLNACDQELSLLKRKLELLKKQKQGLMQQLLTGKVRVKV